MKVSQSQRFSRGIKKLHKNEKKALNKAVTDISQNPEIGEAKTGDLLGMYVHKFKVRDQKWLLMYQILSPDEIRLVVVGAHENFYRDQKRRS